MDNRFNRRSRDTYVVSSSPNDNQLRCRYMMRVENCSIQFVDNIIDMFLASTDYDVNMYDHAY